PKPETCVEGEVWKECVGSSCAELTCKDPVASNGCTLDCNYGCYCADGLYRDVKKNCVRIEHTICSPGSENAPTTEACGEGEVWKNCVGGSCAELTCEHPKPPNGCTKDCNYGCYCGEGYYRNSQEQCVTKEQCT
ncbi:secreted protein, putative, partial [Ixodes scapularis]